MRDSNRELLEQKLHRPFLPPESFGKLRTWMDLDGVAMTAAALLFAVLILFGVAQITRGGQIGDPEVQTRSVVLGDSVEEMLTGTGDAADGAENTVAQSDASDSSPRRVDDVGGQTLDALATPDRTLPDVVAVQDSTGQGLSALQGAAAARREQKALAKAASMALGGTQVTGVLRVDPGVKTVVYVIDRSSSMSADRRLDRVKAELVFAIRALEEGQKFAIVFFDNGTYALGDDGSGLRGSDSDPLKVFQATAENKKRAIDWIGLHSPTGGTNPTPACLRGLAVRPDLMMLLSDGEFAPDLVNEITRRNHEKSRKPARIDCVGVAESIQTLQDIAKQNKGIYFSAR
jgi:hypothetical protein